MLGLKLRWEYLGFYSSGANNWLKIINDSLILLVSRVFPRRAHLTLRTSTENIYMNEPLLLCYQLSCLESAIRIPKLNFPLIRLELSNFCSKTVNCWSTSRRSVDWMSRIGPDFRRLTLAWHLRYVKRLSLCSLDVCWKMLQVMICWERKLMKMRKTLFNHQMLDGAYDFNFLLPLTHVSFLCCVHMWRRKTRRIFTVGSMCLHEFLIVVDGIDVYYTKRCSR